MKKLSRNPNPMKGIEFAIATAKEVIVIDGKILQIIFKLTANQIFGGWPWNCISYKNKYFDEYSYLSYIIWTKNHIKRAY